MRISTQLISQADADYLQQAVKEFSKSRLRKRAQSNLLRRPNQKRPSGYLAPDASLFPPHHRRSSSGSGQAGPASNNSLDLIKEEIAIMKKLDHTNLVSLIEVLDDPEEDSLYMVLEMCKKGVVMKVGLDDVADPYDDETCRCWFRDMMLGIEYCKSSTPTAVHSHISSACSRHYPPRHQARQLPGDRRRCPQDC